jgi:hypothetical protein
MVRRCRGMRNYESIEMLLTELEYKNGEFYRNGKVMKQYKSGKGKYMYVEVGKNGKRYRSSVHCLVFALHHGIEELKKHETVDHMNGNKYDNRIENLQGLSRFENSQKDSGGKLSVEDARMIKILINNGVPLVRIAEKFGVSGVTISIIKRGLRFRYVEV